MRQTYPATRRFLFYLGIWILVWYVAIDPLLTTLADLAVRLGR